MLRPSMTQILKPGESYYEFVVAVARKAREIASDAEADDICLEEKPVTMAVQLFASGEEKLSDINVSIEGPVTAHGEEHPAPEAEDLELELENEEEA